jgi:ribonuclease PH
MEPTPGPSYESAAPRADGRRPAMLRPVTIEPDFIPQAAGSVLFCQGNTRVVATASVEDGVPGWLRGQSRGWLTAEYGMLPASTGQRRAREAVRGRQDGRTVEIQRLIGRSLRAVVDLAGLGERTVHVDCDVLQADAGTRCAAISGGYVAVRRALGDLVEAGGLAEVPVRDSVAGVSVAVVGGELLLDPDYAEDRVADVDMNVVMTGSGELVEVQATAEGAPLTRADLDDLLDLAEQGLRSIRVAQEAAVHARPRT